MAKKKNYNVNLIKKSANYSIADIAALFKIHKRTVQQWLKEGLPKIDNKKPCCMMGYALKEFIENRQQKRKKKCGNNEFYCCKCREARQVLNNAVDIKILNEKVALLTGVCGCCNTTVNRIASLKKLAEIAKIFAVQTIHNKDLVESNLSIVNTDIKKELSI